MKRKIIVIVAGLIFAACIVLGIVSGFDLDGQQLQTLKILAIVCGCSALYCFVVGEITGNTSQMDKLWSILPIAYTWIVAIRGNCAPRLLIIAILVTLWGIRLTINFARKGAYSIKFWSGEEDYRWKYLREHTVLRNSALFSLFDFFFISIYQNVLVCAMTLPAVAVQSSTAPISYVDIIAAVVALFFLAYETIADEQQNKFQTTKWNMIKEGKKLEELPEPYDLGFNTVGLWKRSRHPNYLGEQMFWFAIYLFVLGAGVTKFGFFNWSILGSMFIFLLFMGSSMLGEHITSGKYPLFKEYQDQVLKYLPIHAYKHEEK